MQTSIGSGRNTSTHGESEEPSTGGPHVIMRFPDLRTSYSSRTTGPRRNPSTGTSVHGLPSAVDLLGQLARRLRPILATGWGKLGLGILILALTQGVFLSLFVGLFGSKASSAPALSTPSLSVGFGPTLQQPSNASSTLADRTLSSSLAEPSSASQFPPLSEPTKTAAIPLDLHPGVSNAPREIPTFNGPTLGDADDLPPWDLSTTSTTTAAPKAPATPTAALPETKQDSTAAKSATRLRGVIQ